MRTQILLCLLLFSLMGYAQQEIDLAGNLSNYEEIPLSKVASKVEYIPLETTDKCLLSNELQIHWGKDDIFVGDIKMMKFYRFDKTGKFLNAIGEVGDGPEAYPNALAFFVDEEETCVYVIGSTTRTLYKYTYSGEFQKKIPMGISSWSISTLNNNIVGYNNRYNRIKNQKEPVYELYLFDVNGKELAKAPTTVTSEKDDMLLFQLPFFYKYNNQLFYKNAVSEYIYHIGDDLNMSPHYKITGGGNNQSGNDIRNIKKYADKITVKQVSESDAWILISYVYKNKMAYLLYDKLKGTYANVRSGSENGFKDDLAGGPIFQPFHAGSSNLSCFLAVLPVEKAIESNIPSLKELSADANPVLGIATLK